MFISFHTQRASQIKKNPYLKNPPPLCRSHFHPPVRGSMASQAHTSVSSSSSADAKKHTGALQMGCKELSQLAQRSVHNVLLSKITNEQWKAGVFVSFEPTVSRTFFETFAVALHGKAGGVKVLVNASQRLLGVQLTDPQKKEEKKKKESYLLIKVADDGQFVITTTNGGTGVTTPPPPSPSPAPVALPLPSVAE